MRMLSKILINYRFEILFHLIKSNKLYKTTPVSLQNYFTIATVPMDLTVGNELAFLSTQSADLRFI